MEYRRKRLDCNVSRWRGTSNAYRTFMGKITLRLGFGRLVVSNRGVLGCLRIVASGFGAVGVELSGSSTTVLVQDHGSRHELV
jgi:hypothetical protein